MAKRLAIAGLNVAYGRKNYPTGGPFPVDLKAGLYNVPYSPPPPWFQSTLEAFQKGEEKREEKEEKKRRKTDKKKTKGQKIEV